MRPLSEKVGTEPTKPFSAADKSLQDMIEFTKLLTTRSDEQMDESASLPNCPCVCHPNLPPVELDLLGTASVANCPCVCHPTEAKPTAGTWIDKVEQSANQLVDDVLEPLERPQEEQVEPSGNEKSPGELITVPCEAIKNIRIECKCSARRMKQTEPADASRESIKEESQQEADDAPELEERRCADGCGCSCHPHQEELADDESKPEDGTKSVEEQQEEPTDETESLPALGKRIVIPCSELKNIRLECQCFARKMKDQEEAQSDEATPDDEDQSRRCSTGCPCHCHPSDDPAEKTAACAEACVVHCISDDKESKRGSGSEATAEASKLPAVENPKPEDSKPATDSRVKDPAEAPSGRRATDGKSGDSFMKRLTSPFRQSK